MLIRPVASIESIYGDACSLVAAVQSIASDATWKYLTPELYATFWQLGMSDLHVPRQAYAEAQKKLQEQLTAPQTEKTEDRGDKKSDQKEKIQASITALQKELARQEELGNQCSERLKSEHSTWFKIGAAVLAVHAAPPPPANATFPLPNSMRSRLISSTTAFFQFCLLPRLLSSPLDSMYCATFVERLIELNTPGFSFIELLDVVSRSVRPLIACSTTNEMSRFARFLHLLFRQVAHWLYRIQFEKQTPKLCAFFQHDRGSPYTFTMVRLCSLGFFNFSIIIS
jgi:THO complex subunit 2